MPNRNLPSLNGFMFVIIIKGSEYFSPHTFDENVFWTGFRPCFRELNLTYVLNIGSTQSLDFLVALVCDTANFGSFVALVEANS